MVNTEYNLTPCQQEVLEKYDPSSRVILYGCASPAEGELCSSRTTNGLDFEWEQVRQGVVKNVYTDPKHVPYKEEVCAVPHP